MKTIALATIAGVAVFLGACASPVDHYEAGVQDLEPVYCYKTIGGVQCHDAPKHWDERRLVNYYGPHPSRYEREEWKKPEPGIAPPPPIDYFARDPEPVPAVPPKSSAAEPLPWKQQSDATGSPAVPEAETAQALTEAAPEAEDPWLRSVREAVSGI